MSFASLALGPGDGGGGQEGRAARACAQGPRYGRSTRSKRLLFPEAPSSDSAGASAADQLTSFRYISAF